LLRFLFFLLPLKLSNYSLSSHVTGRAVSQLPLLLSPLLALSLFFPPMPWLSTIAVAAVAVAGLVDVFSAHAPAVDDHRGCCRCCWPCRCLFRPHPCCWGLPLLLLMLLLH
jgi:hypothetical protein